MQERLSRDPFEALGLGSSDPTEVRTAFLALTKTFHPARFARMATEIQRLSNEVFLGLRAAHDQLVRAQVKTPQRSTAVLPAFKPGTAPVPSTRPPTGSIPVLRPATPPATATSPTATAAPPRTGTQGQVVRSPVAPATPGARTSTTGNNPPHARPTPTHAQTTQPMRPFGANPTNDPARPPNRMPSSSPAPASGQTAATTSGRIPAVAGGRGDDELAAIHELLAQDRLTDARIKLEAIVARAPSPKYQALIHYAKGREAQLAGRRDEARLELLDALDLDKDLALANTALGELLSKRK